MTGVTSRLFEDSFCPAFTAATFRGCRLKQSVLLQRKTEGFVQECTQEYMLSSTSEAMKVDLSSDLPGMGQVNPAVSKMQHAGAASAK